MNTNIIHQILLQIVDANPTKYTNDDKLSINNILEEVKYDQLNRSLDQTRKLQYYVPEKYDIQQKAIFDLSKLADIESLKNVKSEEIIVKTFSKKTTLDFNKVSVENFDNAFDFSEYLIEKCTTLEITSCLINF